MHALRKGVISSIAALAISTGASAGAPPESQYVRNVVAQCRADPLSCSMFTYVSENWFKFCYDAVSTDSQYSSRNEYYLEYCGTLAAKELLGFAEALIPSVVRDATTVIGQRQVVDPLGACRTAQDVAVERLLAYDTLLYQWMGEANSLEARNMLCPNCRFQTYTKHTSFKGTLDGLQKKVSDALGTATACDFPVPTQCVGK